MNSLDIQEIEEKQPEPVYLHPEYNNNGQFIGLFDQNHRWVAGITKLYQTTAMLEAQKMTIDIIGHNKKGETLTSYWPVKEDPINEKRR